MIATNCDRLELYAGRAAPRHRAAGRRDYAGLAYPPAFADLTVDGAGRPELRIDGYVGGMLAATVRCRPTPRATGWRCRRTTPRSAADGADTTRLTFRAVDAYGNQRP